jgi:hypothetical protein
MLIGTGSIQGKVVQQPAQLAADGSPVPVTFYYTDPIPARIMPKSIDLTAKSSEGNAYIRSIYEILIDNNEAALPIRNGAIERIKLETNTGVIKECNIISVEYLEATNIVRIYV